MQELRGRLTVLDPEASEALRVVAYFDDLVSAAVGIDGLLRAAAVMSGAVVGFEQRGRRRRFDPAGRRLGGGAESSRVQKRDSARFSVWLERESSAHANDEIVLERLVLAIELRDTSNRSPTGLDTIADGSATLDERSAALARHRIGPGDRVRFIATGLDDVGKQQGLSTVIATRYGMLRATLDLRGDESLEGPAGLGPWVAADHAPESWTGATIAYRLTSPDDPVIDATSLGAMLELVQCYEPERPHRDVTSLQKLDEHELETIRALVEAESIRSAAVRLGIHHSTMRARHEVITEKVGFDPRTPDGRMRAIAAVLLLRLHHA